MFGGKIGFWEVVLLLIVALVVVGPKKLPEVGRSIGKAINEFKKGSKEMTDEFKNSLDDDDEKDA